MITVKDLDGNIYRIPKALDEKFKMLLSKIETTKMLSPAWYDANAELDNAFGEYMKG